jgi:hypothetical protein
MKIEIEESALDSLKAMVQKLQDERDMLLKQMQNISAIQNQEWGSDYEEIDGARLIANNTIAACTETKQVMAQK